MDLFLKVYGNACKITRKVHLVLEFSPQRDKAHKDIEYCGHYISNNLIFFIFSWKNILLHTYY